MGKNQLKPKKYELHMNKKFNEMVLKTINLNNTLENEERIKTLMRKNISKEIKLSNFSKIFNKRKEEINNITSLLNLIYIKNTNTCLKLSSNITLYESIFNYDIKPKNMIQDVPLKSNYEIDNFLNYIHLINLEELKQNTEPNKPNKTFKIKQQKKNIKKHNQNPKYPPVAIINLNFNEIIKEVAMERSLNEMKKNKKKRKSPIKNEKKEIKNFTINGKINPSLINNNNFKDALDFLNKPNK